MAERESRNETQLTARIVREIKSRYPEAWVLKTHGDGYQRMGVPDLLVCHRGVLHGIEVKHRKPGESIERMRGRVSTAQRREIEAIRSAGSVAGMVWTVEQALGLLEQTERRHL